MIFSLKSNAQSLKSLRRTSEEHHWTALPAALLARPSAFTLIEIMVVVGIMAMVMLMSIPFVRNTMHREALTQAMRDLEEVCGNARRKAILQGSMAEVIFHPKERTFQVAGGAPTSSNAGSASPETTTAPPANSGDSGRVADTLIVDMLDVNLSEYKDSDEARVRFYPNGTSDELTVIIHNEKGEYFKMALEATTGLPNWERDPSKFK
jgi:prepilin-type N-terminal cleavage/methylation domain-containing protein